VFRGPGRLSQERLNVSDGLILSVDLSSPGIVGYRAKPNSALLDLSKRESYDPKDYWEELRAPANRSLILEPEDFYLLASWERVQVPPSIAVEMAAYDPTSGELRTHYAGFFDPGFGHSITKGWSGTPAVLEVRAHDVPFILEHGQRLCRLTAERMQSLPTNLYGVNQGSRYQRQHLALGPQFRHGESHHMKPPRRPIVGKQSTEIVEANDDSRLWDTRADGRS
jgi:dCTP deaminase